MREFKQVFWKLCSYALTLALFLFLLRGGYSFLAILLGAAYIFYGVMQPGPADRRRKVANMLQELSLALAKKMPLDDIIDALASEEHGDFAERLNLVALQLRQGRPLSEALCAARCVPAHAIASIKAAEATGGGGLQGALYEVSRELRHEAAGMNLAWAAVFYPLAVMSILAPVAGFMLVFIYPRFAYINAAMRVPFSLYWVPWLACIAFGALLLVYVWHLRWESPLTFRLFSSLNRLSIFLEDSLPVFRTRLREGSLARSARALACMTAGGVDFPRAAREVAHPAVSGPYAAAFEKLSRSAESGVPVSDALRVAHFPDSFTALACAGASSGDFPAAMRLAAEWHGARARHADQVLVALLPCVTIPLTGLFVAAFYMPVFIQWATVVELFVKGAMR